MYHGSDEIPKLVAIVGHLPVEWADVVGYQLGEDDEVSLELSAHWFLDLSKDSLSQG